MTTAQLRKRAKERLEDLPPGKVRVAAEFLDYLGTAASRDATAELLKVPGILQDVQDAVKQVKRGEGKNWRKVRKDDYGLPDAAVGPCGGRISACGSTHRTTERG